MKFPDAAVARVQEMESRIEEVRRQLGAYLIGVRDAMGLDDGWEIDLPVRRFVREGGKDAEAGGGKGGDTPGCAGGDCGGDAVAGGAGAG